MGAQAGGVRGEVDGQHVPGQLSGGRVAEPEVLEGALAAARLGQVADAPEAVVVEQHDGQRDALLDGRRDLRGHHQPRAVADHHVHPSGGLRHRDADATGHLVAHRGVAVLQVVAAGSRRAPQLVQVTRQAARGADHDAVPARRLVHQPDRFRLRDVRRRGQCTHPLDLAVPGLSKAIGLGSRGARRRPR